MSDQLFNAVKGGILKDVTDALKEQGINVNEPDDQGRNALDWAADKKNADIIKALLDKGATIDTTVGAKLLPWAAQNDNSDLVDKILKVPGIDVNAKDGADKTALDWAADKKNADIIKALLDKGATIDTTVGAKLLPWLLKMTTVI